MEIQRRRPADNTPELPAHMGLIGKTAGERQFGKGYARPVQLSRSHKAIDTNQLARRESSRSQRAALERPYRKTLIVGDLSYRIEKGTTFQGLLQRNKQ